MNSSYSHPDTGVAVLRTGFRPFFLGAAAYAVVSMVLWAAVYRGAVDLTLAPLSAMQWHAHEMIYGYALAVVAGFLLTAVRNWTGVPTVQGPLLGILAGVWLGARFASVFGTRYVALAMLLDLAFVCGLLVAIGVPLAKARQWRQGGVAAKLLLLATGNTVYYLGIFGVVEHGVFLGIYGGLYLLVSLVLTIGGRVLPGFIERGVDPPVRIVTPRWMMPMNLVLFVAFFIVELFFRDAQGVAGTLAAALFAVNFARLCVWHTPGIWCRPLLWGLYLAFVFVDLGFLLVALSAFAGISKALALHAFGLGGIGLATLSMMARVALGHTGRSIHAPPPAVTLALGGLVLATLIRIGWPLFDSAHYAGAVAASQVLWAAVFLIFAVAYRPLLTQPRVDGQAG